MTFRRVRQPDGVAVAYDDETAWPELDALEAELKRRGIVSDD